MTIMDSCSLVDYSPCLYDIILQSMMYMLLYVRYYELYGSIILSKCRIGGEYFSDNIISNATSMNSFTINSIGVIVFSPKQCSSTYGSVSDNQLSTYIFIPSLHHPLILIDYTRF